MLADRGSRRLARAWRRRTASTFAPPQSDTNTDLAVGRHQRGIRFGAPAERSAVTFRSLEIDHRHGGAEHLDRNSSVPSGVTAMPPMNPESFERLERRLERRASRGRSALACLQRSRRSSRTRSRRSVRRRRRRAACRQDARRGRARRDRPERRLDVEVRGVEDRQRRLGPAVVGDRSGSGRPATTPC